MRIRAALLNPPLQPFVHQDVHGPGTMGTGGRDLNLEPFVPEAPLHEGRGECIFRSSSEDALAGAEMQPVRSPIGGDGKAQLTSPRALRTRKNR
jgi:hypothetical protein